MKKGWRKEPARHSLAARGIETRPLKELKKRLLLFGGKGFDGDFKVSELETGWLFVTPEDLLERGKVFDKSEVTAVRGASGRCHNQSLRMVADDPHAELWHGVALDGNTWRVHSWVVKRGKAIETCGRPWDLYLGVRIEDEADIQDFAELMTADLGYWMTRYDRR